MTTVTPIPNLFSGHHPINPQDLLARYNVNLRTGQLTAPLAVSCGDFVREFTNERMATATLETVSRNPSGSIRLPQGIHVDGRLNRYLPCHIAPWLLQQAFLHSGINQKDLPHKKPITTSFDTHTTFEASRSGFSSLAFYYYTLTVRGDEGRFLQIQQSYVRNLEDYSSDMGDGDTMICMGIERGAVRLYAKYEPRVEERDPRDYVDLVVEATGNIVDLLPIPDPKVVTFKTAPDHKKHITGTKGFDWPGASSGLLTYLQPLLVRAEIRVPEGMLWS